MSDGRPTVVVADDHRPMREMLVAVLRNDGFHVAGEAGDADGAIDLAHVIDPTSACSTSACRATGSLPPRDLGAGSRDDVVMLTVLVTTTTSSRRCGPVHGATSSRADRRPKWRPRCTGRSPGNRRSRRASRCGSSTSSPAATPPRPVPDRGFVHLSPREAEVLEMLRQGLTTSLIAHRLCVSRSPSVRTFRHCSASSTLRIVEEALSLFET